MNQSQPVQDIHHQYNSYVKDGYNDEFFKKLNSHTPHMGVWITCFVAFLQKDEDVKTFLNLWYLQTLQYTTQDQVGFPKVAQDTKLVPYTLPDSRFTGDDAHGETSIFKVHKHGT